MGAVSGFVLGFRGRCKRALLLRERLLSSRSNFAITRDTRNPSGAIRWPRSERRIPKGTRRAWWSFSSSMRFSAAGRRKTTSSLLNLSTTSFTRFAIARALDATGLRCDVSLAINAIYSQLRRAFGMHQFIKGDVRVDVGGRRTLADVYRWEDDVTRIEVVVDLETGVGTYEVSSRELSQVAIARILGRRNQASGAPMSAASCHSAGRS